MVMKAVLQMDKAELGRDRIGIVLPKLVDVREHR